MQGEKILIIILSISCGAASLLVLGFWWFGKKAEKVDDEYVEDWWERENL